MNISHILRNRPTAVHSVGPDQLLTDAVALMMEHRIGALLVMEGETMVSIVSERDVMRAVNDYDANLGGVTVRQVMASKLVVCHAEDSIDQAMDQMMHNETGRRVRHLPVVDGETPLGVISIADIVEALLTSVEFENKLLKNYIRNWPEHD